MRSLCPSSRPGPLRVALILAAICLAGCIPSQVSGSPEAAVRDFAYLLPQVGTFRLQDGRYLGGRDSAAVRLAQSAAGDLDGDGARDVAVVLMVSGGAKPEVYLVALLNRAGRLEQAGSAALGAAADVQSLAVHNEQLIVEYKVHEPGDLPCCASRYQQSTYELRGGRLQAGATAAGATTGEDVRR